MKTQGQECSQEDVTERDANVTTSQYLNSKPQTHQEHQ